MHIRIGVYELDNPFLAPQFNVAGNFDGPLTSCTSVLGWRAGVPCTRLTPNRWHRIHTEGGRCTSYIVQALSVVEFTNTGTDFFL